MPLHLGVDGEKTAQKACAQLRTSEGNLNLELYADVAPMACENFIRLAERGYYRGVHLHRLLKNFMVQGGDPTGTGCGGESCWGEPFNDEISAKFKHEVGVAGRGVHVGGNWLMLGGHCWSLS